MKKERLVGIDAVRTAAILFVIVLHSISITQRMETDVQSLPWYGYLYLRHLTLACVPLFLMLSGFLQRGKTPSRAYYRGILPLYLAYFVISVLSVAAQALYGLLHGGTDLTLLNCLYRIFDFSANGYAWYFEMFLGLFLLIPFLNLLWQGIGTQKGRLLLIGSLAFLTLLPDTVTTFAPYYSGTGSSISLNVIPDFFKAMYPITYYYIGSYIAEYRPAPRRSLRIAAFLAAPLVPAGLTAIFTALRGEYAWYTFYTFQTVPVCLTAVSVFLLLYDLPIRSGVLRKLLSAVATVTFEMYLLSWIWDEFLYAALPFPQPVMVIAIFLCTFVSAYLLHLLLKPLSAWLLRLYDRIFC